MITVADIIAKRERIWKEREDINYDADLVRASVRKILSEEYLAKEIKAKPYLLIEVAFTIVDKKKKTVPFFFNEVQKDFLRQFEEKGTNKPFYVLKGRQQGFTSLITAIQLACSITTKNFSGFTLADKADNTRAIFNDKARMVYERLPDELKPTERYNSINELFFDKLNSSWRVATATDQVGRSRTLNFVHYSEIAFYECSLAELQKSIGEATTDDAFRIYETTANGYNEAKDLWDSGSCYNLFYGWWATKEYRSTEYEYIERADKWLNDRIQVLKGMGLDREQIAWYCKKYNSYLDKNAIKQEYPISPEEAFVSSGNCVFDKELIVAQLSKISALKSEKKGYFIYDKITVPIVNSDGITTDVEQQIQNIKFYEAADGYITIHDEPRVKRNDKEAITAKCPYVIGGDTAGSGEDYFTAKVIDNITGNTVATLHKQRIDEDIYAEQIYCLGKYYNEALIGIETNYSRQPMRVLQRYGYGNLYIRERTDRITKEVEKVFGFETTVKTKPLIIAELVEIFRQTPDIEIDKATLREMLTFVKKDNGKQEASDGAHDDLVMALAIAHFISSQQDKQWIKVDLPEDDFITKNFHKEQERDGAFIEWEEF